MSIADLLRGGTRLPVLRSSEISECGLVCVAMIAAFHGRHESLTSLRQRISISTSGLRLRDLLNIAEGLGLSGRAVRVDLEGLPHLQRPALLHWGLSHFVVLKDLTLRGATIHDPAVGVRRVTRAELSQMYTGVAVEFTPAKDFQRGVIRETTRLSTVIPSVRGAAATVLLLIALSLALQVCAFVAPLQIQMVVDKSLAAQNGGILPAIALGFGLLALIQILLDGVRGWTIQVAGTVFMYQAAGNLVRHLMRLPATFFERRQLADITSRIGSASSIKDVLTRGVITAVVDGLMTLLASLLLFVYSPVLAFLVLIGFCLNVMLTQTLYVPTAVLSREQLQASAREQAHMLEMIRSAITIKVLGAEAERQAVWRNLYARVLSGGQRIARLQIWTSAGSQALTTLQYSLILFLGAEKVLAGGFSLGMLMAFLAYQRLVLERGNSFLGQLTQLRLISVHLERIADIVNTTPEPVEGSGHRFEDAGNLDIANVGFRYGVSDAPVLQDVSLRIASGDFVALVGPTGGGKTTLLKLLLGLHTPDAGKILIDGQQATPELWRSWRQMVGYVGQDDYPMSGTVAENIAFFDPELNMEQVIRCAKRVHLHDEIMAAPLQYRTHITEMGANISGGQRQRLLIARALYREPKVLVLDEGTANLDSDTERRIADLLSDLPITRIVVAHRPALVERAHRVFALENGRIRIIRDALGPDVQPHQAGASIDA